MDTTLCKLTLVYPTAGEEHIIDVFLASEPAIGGFTTWVADGHGHDFANASARERVRGRVRRGVLVAVMEKGRAEALLDEVQKKAPVPHLTCWLEPVTDFLRLTAATPEEKPVEPE